MIISRKEMLIRLYKTVVLIQNRIEENLDLYSDEGNTADFEIMLNDLLGLCAKLLKKESDG